MAAIASQLELSEGEMATLDPPARLGLLRAAMQAVEVDAQLRALAVQEHALQVHGGMLAHASEQVSALRPALPSQRLCILILATDTHTHTYTFTHTHTLSLPQTLTLTLTHSRVRSLG